MGSSFSLAISAFREALANIGTKSGRRIQEAPSPPRPPPPCSVVPITNDLVRKGSQKAVAPPGCAYRGEPRSLVRLPASAQPASESPIGGYSLWRSGAGGASGGHDAQATPRRRHPAR